MYTYALIGLPFILAACLIDVAGLRTGIIRQRRTWLVAGVMMLATVIFDQFIAKFFVIYTEVHTLGLRLGWAPIEDFAYTLVAVILVGSGITYGKRKGWS